MNMLTVEFRDLSERTSRIDFSFSAILLLALICVMAFWTPSSQAYEANDPLEPVNRAAWK